MRTVVLGACLLFSVSLGAATPPGPSNDWDLRWMVGGPIEAPKPPPPETPKLRALGRPLFQARCAGCHGENGDGQGPQAARLAVRPTNFTLGVYKIRSTPTGSIPTDGDLFATVTRGIHGTPMLPWTTLSEEERWALVYRLKSFSVRFREERPARPISVPTPPRGRFIRGAELADLYLTLRTGIEGTPMAAYDTLRDGEIWALAAYVRSLVRERPLYELPPARTHARAADVAPPASLIR